MQLNIIMRKYSIKKQSDKKTLPFNEDRVSSFILLYSFLLLLYLLFYPSEFHQLVEEKGE